MVGRHGILLDIPFVDRLITGPTLEPLTLEEVRLQIRFPSTREDTLIAGWITAARQAFEHATGRQLLEATHERELQTYPAGVIELPHPPLLEVVSVITLDADGAEQILTAGTDYVVDQPTGDFAARGSVRAIGSWPTSGPVRVRYRAGYGTAATDVPALASAALFMRVATLHKYRAAVQETGDALITVPLGYDEIVRAFAESARSRYPPQRAWSTVLA